jgi:lipid A 3-O-deacylase
MIGSRLLLAIALSAALVTPSLAEAPQAITPLALPVKPAPVNLTEIERQEIEGGGGRLVVMLENDILGAGTDRNYSNGVRFAWLGEAAAVPDWVNQLARWLPLVHEGRKSRLLLELGQSIFTPESLADARPPDGERPYAGWLYLGLSAILEDESQISRLGLLAGVLGPLAGAGSTQTLVHGLLGMEQPNGWESQPDSRPGFVLLLDRFWKLVKAAPEDAIELEILPHAGVAAGNVFSHASGGVLIRLGSDLGKEALPASIMPGLAPGGAAEAEDGGFRWFFFIDLGGRAVAHNTLVSGLEGEGPDANWLVGDVTAGLTLSYGGIALTYARTLRTAEAVGQETPDSFGGVTLSLDF